MKKNDDLGLQMLLAFERLKKIVKYKERQRKIDEARVRAKRRHNFHLYKQAHIQDLTEARHLFELNQKRANAKSAIILTQDGSVFRADLAKQ